MNTQTFIKTDDNVVVNMDCIRWIKKLDDCLYICAKSNGCPSLDNTKGSGKHEICKAKNAQNYNKLNKLFN